MAKAQKVYTVANLPCISSTDTKLTEKHYIVLHKCLSKNYQNLTTQFAWLFNSYLAFFSLLFFFTEFCMTTVLQLGVYIYIYIYIHISFINSFEASEDFSSLTVKILLKGNNNNNNF